VQRQFELGRLSFFATFTDGSAGVFVSNLVAVLEPSSLLLAALAGASGILGRRANGRNEWITKDGCTLNELQTAATKQVDEP
jgi:hypothetical protein